MGSHKSAPERCTYHYFPVVRGNALSTTKTEETLSSFSRGSQDSVFIFGSGLGGGKLRLLLTIFSRKELCLKNPP